MVHQVQIAVKIGGNDISPITYCCINQSIDWHHQFEVIYAVDFYKDKYNDILNKVRDYIGTEIEISFEKIESGQNNIKNSFFGLVTEVKLSRTSEGKKEIHISGFSPTILIDGQFNFRSFTSKKLGEIAQDTLDQIPQNELKFNCNPSYKGEIPYLVQYNESNYHFLNRIAERYGEWCFYSGSELIFGPLNKSKTIDIVIDKNLIGFDFTFSIKNLNYKAIAYDYRDNKTFLKETKGFSVTDLDQHGDLSFRKSEKVFKQQCSAFPKENFSNEMDFKEFLETKKVAETRKLICNEGTSSNPIINVGTVVKIKSESDLENDFGEFILTSVIHTIDSERNYLNYFKAIPKQNNKPAINEHVTLPVCDIQPAVVIDNDDPEKLGRVKVRFFWQTAQDNTPWLRIIHPHGGKSDGGEQYGFYFIPEIADEVMVGFEGNNPDKPFVMGSVYHKNSKPDHWYHSKNNVKSIRTRNGNQIILNDEDGKEEIRILNTDDGAPKNEISLSMGNNGKITIKTEGELEISADTIKISAKSDMQIESGKTTKITATDLNATANNGVSIKGQQLDLEGTTKTNVKATTLKIDASAKAEVSSAMTKVAGSGLTEITGGLVKIN